MIPGRTYTPQDVIDALRRRWIWMAGAFAVLALVALAVVLQMPRSYTSVATLQVVSEPAADAYVRTTPQARLSDRLQSIGRTTLTRPRLESIITDLDLYPDMRQRVPMDYVLDRMRSEIVFKSTDKDVFNLGFVAQDRHKALQVATRLTSLFLEENSRDREEQAQAATRFLDAQLESVRKTLDEQEAKLEAYKSQHAGQLPSQLSMNVQELNNSQNNLRSVLDTIARDQEQKLLLQRQLEAAQNLPETVLPMAGVDTAAALGADPLETARAQLKALELRLTPEHPDIQRAKRLIAKLEQQAAADGSPAGTAASASSLRRDFQIRDLRAQIDTIDRRIGSNQEQVRQLRARIDDYSRRIDATPLRESEMATLSRDHDDTKKLYSSLLVKRQEAGMAANLEQKDLGDRFRLIESAQLPEMPSSKSRRSQFLLGLLAALGLAVGLGAFLEYRDTSIRSELDITAALGLPVLALIPDLGRWGPRRTR